MEKRYADKIIVEFMEKIYGFAFSKTKNIDVAEDLASKIIYDVYKQLLKKDNIQNPAGYVYKISKNVYAKYLKDEKQIEYISFDNKNQFKKLNYEHTEKKFHLKIRSEISKLNEYQRKIIMMYFYQHIKQKEIAQSLNLPIGTVKWHLKEAKKILKERLNMRKKNSNSIQTQVFRKDNSKQVLHTSNILITLIKKPARKILIYRGKQAEEYFSYCEELGCDIWAYLKELSKKVNLSINNAQESLFNEPICLWLPEKYIKPNTSLYVQGIELPLNYDIEILEGQDTINLPPAIYLMFQGETFQETDFGKAIKAIWRSINNYHPSLLGYEWDLDNPRIQLEPICDRGYIELVSVKLLNKNEK